MAEKKVLHVEITAVILAFLGFAAYFVGHDPIKTLSLIAIVGFLQLLLMAINWETSRHQNVTVLVPNFMGRQWLATVEMDQMGRLTAPADPSHRKLTPAPDVMKGIHILRAPHYEPKGSAIVMVGGWYEVAPMPFHE